MKQFAVAVLLVMGLVMAGCGSNGSGSVNGTWNATLTGNNAAPVFTFGTSLTTNSNGGLNITNFSFTTSSPCFSSGETETGSFTLSGNFSGQVHGSFGMTISSVSPAGNTLVLNGTETGNTISGTWTLTGSSGCTGSGTFTMTKVGS